ncbi:VOC family protein [Micromonospora sp. NPDC005806]|uniref:VOC family protein n=1 Tax=Micromonospora sp. NPDC005806 TaxID=3364234 RepID=UPI0036D07CFB
MVDPDGVGPRIWFQPVPEAKVVKNRLHLDIKIADRTAALQTRREQVDTEVERLTGLGATVVRVLADPGMDHYAVTIHDPEGNEFCVGPTAGRRGLWGSIIPSPSMAWPHVVLAMRLGHDRASCHCA